MGIRVSENLKEIDGHFQLRVGTITTRERVQTGSVRHENPLVEGTVPVYGYQDETWWVVYLYGSADPNAEPLVHTDRKSDTINFLQMLLSEVTAAITELEEMDGS